MPKGLDSKGKKISLVVCEPHGPRILLLFSDNNPLGMWITVILSPVRTANSPAPARITLDPALQLTIQLKKWRLACPQSALDLIFPNEAGKPLSPINMVRRKFEPALKRAEIERIRFHDLRHTYASIQIELGENPKYIQHQMGHSSIKITFDTYGHLMKTVNREAANRLGEAIFGSDGS